MQVFTDPATLPEAARGAVVAIGNFDGVHPGHLMVIGECRRIADREGRPAAVMAFEPHPRSFFRPDQPTFRLTPAAHRARLLAAAGMDAHFLLPFDRALATLDAEAFVERVPVGALGVAHVVVGYDFHYGRARQGTPAALVAAGQAHGFGVTVMDQASDEGGGVYSSSRVRTALGEGDMVGAAQALGRPFEIEGTVLAGDRRGRTLGYPTANIDPADYARPRFGVYAVQVGVPADDGTAAVAWHGGVANFGIRPMYALDRPLLEAHLFDFTGDLYGRGVAVRFIRFLRGEGRFDGPAALVAQMDRDSADARAALAATPAPVSSGRAG
jgi:riboflavin kinase/FMN adenylyltransferase